MDLTSTAIPSAGWRENQSHRSTRAVQLLIWCADLLPWPYSEHLIAWVYPIRWLVRPHLLRRAIVWARHYRARGIDQWTLGVSLVSNLGRFVAMESLAGIRHPETKRRNVRLEGEEHLQQALGRGGVILLGFHAGPPGAWLNLRLLGYRITFAGGRPHHRRVSDAWHPFLNPDDHVLSRARQLGTRAAALMRSRQLLLDGGAVFITADGGGTEAFQIPLPGAIVRIRLGWWVLRRQTGAAVIPVFMHREGRTQILRLCPPLPAVHADADDDIAACQRILAKRLDEFVRRHPEQCVGYALRVWA